MVRLRSSRGFGSSGLAKLAHAQNANVTGAGASSLWEAVRSARENAGGERVEPLERLAKLATGKDAAGVLIGMGAVKICADILKESKAAATMTPEQVAALKLLAALCEEPSAAADVLACGLVPAVVERIAVRMAMVRPKDPEGWRLALATLTAVAVQAECRPELLKRGAVGLCIDLGGTGFEDPVRLSALGTILNLANDPKCARAMLKRKVVPMCVACGTDLTGEARFMALGTIKNLLDNVPERAGLGVPEVLGLCLYVYSPAERADTNLLALCVLRELARCERLMEKFISRKVPALCYRVIEDSSNRTRDRVFALQVMDALSSHESAAGKDGAIETLVGLGFVDLCTNVAKCYLHVDQPGGEADARAAAFSVLYNFCALEHIALAMLAHPSLVEVCKGAVAESLTDIRSEALLVLQGLALHARAREPLLQLGVADVCLHVVTMDKSVILLGTLAALDTLRHLSMAPGNRDALLQKGAADVVDAVLQADSGPEARSLAAETRQNLHPTSCVACLPSLRRQRRQRRRSSALASLPDL